MKVIFVIGRVDTYFLVGNDINLNDKNSTSLHKAKQINYIFCIMLWKDLFLSYLIFTNNEKWK